jgi:hypothetical protein
MKEQGKSLARILFGGIPGATFGDDLGAGIRTLALHGAPTPVRRRQAG